MHLMCCLVQNGMLMYNKDYIQTSAIKLINIYFHETGVRILQTVQVSWWITHLSPAIEYPVPMEQQLLPVAPMAICIM